MIAFTTPCLDCILRLQHGSIAIPPSLRDFDHVCDLVPFDRGVGGLVGKPPPDDGDDVAGLLLAMMLMLMKLEVFLLVMILMLLLLMMFCWR